MFRKQLMKVLYLSDVPAYGENRGGTVIIYRLLKNIPPEQLLIIETDYFKRDKDYDAAHPLANVRYIKTAYPFIRLRNTRFAHFYSLVMIRFGRYFFGKTDKIIKHEKIGSIITVSHGFMYFIATAIAAKHNIPCYAIHHDLYLNTVNVKISTARKFLTPLFAQSFSRNAMNYCVSPFMQRFYQERFTGKSIVLYPNRDAAAVTNYIKENQIQIQPVKEQLTFGYLGSINSRPIIELTREFANNIGQKGHQLYLLSNMSQAELDAIKFQYKNVSLIPWIKTEDLIEYLCKHVDVLVLFQDYEPFAMEANAINFPSKLSDYTQTGLPILIIGPTKGSAYKFGEENRKSFWCVAGDGTIDQKALSAVLNDIRDVAKRQEMGEAASKIGDELFSSSVANMLFTAKILA
jgi:hypothetical protein